MSYSHFTLQEVQVIPPHGLQLHYADGQILTLDLRQVIRRHPSLAALQDPAVFATARLGDWGGSVIWNQDDALELAADNLRARAIEQAGEASHEFIIEWMDRHHLTLDQAAQALGLSRRMLAYYRSGARPVPRHVALACVGFSAQAAAPASFGVAFASAL